MARLQSVSSALKPSQSTSEYCVCVSVCVCLCFSVCVVEDKREFDSKCVTGGSAYEAHSVVCVYACVSVCDNVSSVSTQKKSKALSVSLLIFHFHSAASYVTLRGFLLCLPVLPYFQSEDFAVDFLYLCMQFLMHARCCPSHSCMCTATQNFLPA